MRSDSGSMSRSMSVSRTVSSDRSMSIDYDAGKQPLFQDKFSDGVKENDYRSSYRDRDSPVRHRRSLSRSTSRKRSSSSGSYSSYKNYKAFKSKYSSSRSSSRSYSRGRKTKRYSYSSSSSYRSRSSSSDTRRSRSRTRSRTPLRLRRRPGGRRVLGKKSLRDHRSSRDRVREPRFTERRNLRMSVRDRPRMEDKHRSEDEPRLNGRGRQSNRLNGVRNTQNRESRMESKVDRKHNTPFLLKVVAQPSSLGEEETQSSEELHVYVWMDSTLRDLVNLIKDISPPTRKQTKTWTFSTKIGDGFVELGSLHSFKLNSREDNRTLESLKFQIGNSINLTFKD